MSAGNSTQSIMENKHGELSLRELEEWLLAERHDQTAIATRLAAVFEEAIDRARLADEYIDRLAQVLERCGYSAQPGSWTTKADPGLCEIFWTRVAKARQQLKVKEDYVRNIKSAWSSELFEYYSWDCLAEPTVRNLGQIAQRCPRWETARYLLNWAMLKRDKAYRDDLERRPNSAVLIGQHHHNSGLKETSSPLEKKDVCCARKWLDGKESLEVDGEHFWEWDLSTTYEYLRSNRLCFDKWALLVPATDDLADGLDERLVVQVLFRDQMDQPSPAAVSSERGRGAQRSTRGGGGGKPSTASFVASVADDESISQSPLSACGSSPGMDWEASRQEDVPQTDQSSIEGSQQASSLQSPLEYGLHAQMNGPKEDLAPPLSVYQRDIDRLINRVREDIRLQGFGAHLRIIKLLEEAKNACKADDEP